LIQNFHEEIKEKEESDDEESYEDNVDNAQWGQ